jgi:hypothetical protein
MLSALCYFLRTIHHPDSICQTEKISVPLSSCAGLLAGKLAFPASPLNSFGYFAPAFGIHFARINL